MKSLDEMVGDSKDWVKNLFLSQHEKELQAMEAEYEWRGQVTTFFRQTSNDLEAARSFRTALFERLDFLEHCDIANNIYQAAKTQTLPEGVDHLSVNFTGAALVIQHQKKIRDLADADVGALEKKFEQFKAENSKILKELGLI
jgi:hypothetical protein